MNQLLLVSPQKNENSQFKVLRNGSSSNSHHVAYGTAKDTALGRIKPDITERAVEGQLNGDISNHIATSFVDGRLH